VAPGSYTDLHTEVRLGFCVSGSVPMTYGATQSHFHLQVGSSGYGTGNDPSQANIESTKDMWRNPVSRTGPQR
jgi:hypothetical protein